MKYLTESQINFHGKSHARAVPPAEFKSYSCCEPFERILNTLRPVDCSSLYTHNSASQLRIKSLNKSSNLLNCIFRIIKQQQLVQKYAFQTEISFQFSKYFTHKPARSTLEVLPTLIYLKTQDLSEAKYCQLREKTILNHLSYFSVLHMKYFRTQNSYEKAISVLM